MTNIRDVSQLAGVSVATVSRAFSNPEKVAEGTLTRVRAAAAQLNYTPNSLAQIFRKKQTDTVIVIVPDLANAFFSRVLSGIEKVATDAGLSILLANSHDNPEIERECLNMVRGFRADGIIQLGARTIEQLAAGDATKGIPFVHAIESPSSVVTSSVRIDNREAASEIVSHLIELGHRNIGVVAGRKDSQITQERLDGYRKAMSTAGIPALDDAVAHEPYSVRGGESATMQLLDSHDHLTALFCMSDEMAIGAMKALRARGHKLPEEMSVTGFDNIEVGAYLDPGLTTVTQPSKRIGEKAMQLMVSCLRDPDGTQKEHHTLPAELVIRQSTTHPRSL